MTAFCAICCRDIPADDPPILRPLGRANADVRICRACDGETPVARDARAERSFEPGGSLFGIRQALRRIAREHDRERRGLRSSRKPNVALRPSVAGYRLVRVPIRGLDGRARDQHEALATLGGTSWFPQLRYRGVTCRFHLFERPDPELLARMRWSNRRDPLAGFARYRVLNVERWNPIAHHMPLHYPSLPTREP